jgi:hypothetical protein
LSEFVREKSWQWRPLLSNRFDLCPIRKKMLSGLVQCDRMSLWNSRPKCSPTHFLVKLNA